MSAGRRQRIAAHIEITWLQGAPVLDTCPNCGAAGPVTPLLGIDYRPPGAEHRFVLRICPVCTARFADDRRMMDYGTDELIEIGWHVYQVQIGAGLWPIAAPLTRVNKPAGARVLEIGGAYGFGLDFCEHAHGWRGEGYDPSPLAEFGAKALGVTVHQRYFGPADLANGPWDVAIATEVIEHLADPPAFLALLRGALGAAGVLVLTTPDAAWITPELAAERLLPLLSPGAHAVLQTAQSLRMALAAAGFGHVEIRREATSLIAYASVAPLALAPASEAAAGRAMFRRYLVARSAAAEPASDLQLGLAGRGFFEAVNDGDAAAAAGAWAALAPAIAARFGLDLEAFAGLPAAAAGADLAALARLMPLGLGMILFARAMQQLGAGVARPETLPLLAQAAAAVAALQAALAQRSLSDGLSAELGRVLQVEILLGQAELGDPDALASILALEDAAALRRAFSALVNAGRYEAAEALGAAPAFAAALAADDAADARLAALILDLQRGRTAAALARLMDWRQRGAAPGDLAPYLADVLVRLVNEGQYDTAAALAEDGSIERSLPQLPATLWRDGLAALLLLDVQAGQTGRIEQRLAAAKGGGLPAPELEAVTLNAFVALVNATAFAPAGKLRAAVEPMLVKARPPYTAPLRNALFAAGILYLQARADWRRGAAVFSRLRDDVLKTVEPGSTPPDIFWPALRGEILILRRLRRDAEAGALLAHCLTRYPGAPEDLEPRAGAA